MFTILCMELFQVKSIFISITQNYIQSMCGASVQSAQQTTGSQTVGQFRQRKLTEKNLLHEINGDISRRATEEE